MDIFKVGIVGGGAMGGGIAALIAKHGVPVIVKEATPELAEKARQGIYGRFEKWYQRNKIDEHRFEQLKSYVEVTINSADLADVDLLIEAIVEKLEPKLAVFREFDVILRPEVVMASNTSTLPISKLAAATNRPDRVIGTHFFNPPTTMQLVEVVPGEKTSAETLAAIEDFLVSTCKKQLIRAKDQPGFLVNCLLLPYLNEGVLGIEASRVSIEDIDRQAREFGWPMGPFTLLDAVGIDVAYFAGQVIVEAYPERIVIPTVYKKLLDLSRIGEKTGAGFRVMHGEWPDIENLLEEWYPNRGVTLATEEIFERMMAGFLNEAVGALEHRVASKEHIELGCQLGIGCPKNGPLHIVDEMGAAKLLATLEKWAVKEPRFAPYQLLRDMAAKNERFFTDW